MKYLIFVLFILSIGAHAAPPKDIKNFFNDKTKIENPFNLRDPFKAPPSKTDSKIKGRGFTVTGKGQYSNITETNLAGLSVGAIKVVGVLIGKERRALVTDSAGGRKNVIILKEGMKVGPEAAELKAILPGGIVLVEKIVNVYGEEEYLETVIPISK